MRILGPTLDNAIPGSDVMQQIVAKGMNDLVPQRLGNSKHAAVDHRPRRRRPYGFHMANITAEPAEDLSTLQGRRCCCQRRISRWNHRAPDELRKMVDIRQAQLI